MKTLNDAMRYRNRSLVPPPTPSTLRLMHRFPHHPKGSVTALLRKTGPFDPTRDVFGFTNEGWPMTEEDGRILRERYSLLMDTVALSGIHSVTTALKALSMTIPPFGSVGLPAEVITFVVDRVSAELRDSLLELLVGSVPGKYGRCGGMAFAALDFYALGWPIRQHADPNGAELRDYIWSRLIHSIELNGVAFLDWVMNLKVMPVISRSATTAIGAAAGQVIAGPLGAAIGALAASSGDLLHLGGPGVLRDRTRGQLDRLISQLDTEAAWPIGLVYGNQPLPVEQHQILAIGYSHGDRPVLEIWDNNDPQHGRRLLLDFSGDALAVTDVTDAAAIGGSFLPEPKIREIRGIICEAYTFRQPPDVLRLK